MSTKHETEQSCCQHDCSGHHHHSVKTHCHEEALVCSGKCNIDGDLDAVKDILMCEIEKLGKWIEEKINGAIPSTANAFL